MARAGSIPDAALVSPLEVRDLGRLAYEPALHLQRQLQRDLIAGRTLASSSQKLGHLLMVEHDPPVITISRRPDARRNLIASDSQLRSAGVEVAETDRGGDITYHGPGQLVVYPILDLNVLGLRLHGYMRFLEQIIIDLLASYAVGGERDASATGVWVRSAPKTVESPSHGFENQRAAAAKICAMGVRISRWVTMHGLALNVTTNLEHFDLIVPCGLAGRAVTSLQRELGERCPAMDQVKTDLVAQFRRHVTAKLAETRSKTNGKAANGSGEAAA
jgi:lipoyl(octanoyl) transferase